MCKQSKTKDSFTTYHQQADIKPFQDSREFLLKKNAITLTVPLPCKNLQIFGLSCIAVDKYLNNSYRKWPRFEATLVWGIIKTYFCFRSPKCNWQRFARPSIVISSLSFPFRSLRILLQCNSLTPFWSWEKVFLWAVLQGCHQCLGVWQQNSDSYTDISAFTHKQ